ncbi:hypothetical protein [Haladaptatus cibarius]|uniref:hypothetical protein n=1 Tax=Haladaptatus cibarius TaxID=453847 RepID=UPI000678DE47|nr:hypothetical protein [Haladaptatus cibarius]
MRVPVDHRITVVSVLVLSVLLALSGVTPLAGGVGSTPNAKPAVGDSYEANGQVNQFGQFGQLGQYKVSIDNATIRTWALRNATVRNATVDTVRVRRLQTDDEVRRNVTLRNVDVAELEIEEGELNNVTAQRIVVRNRSILDIPGGDIFDPGVRDRVIERTVLANVVVEGANLDALTVENMTVRNVEVPERSDESPVSSAATDPSSAPRPDVVIQNGTAESAVVRNATAGEWSAEEVDRGSEGQETATSSPGNGSDNGNGSNTGGGSDNGNDSNTGNNSDN